MKVRRSLVGTLLCTQALFACYSPDAGENIATESQAFSYQFAGTLSGTRSAGSAYASRGPGLLDLFYLNDVAYPTFPNTVSYRRYVDGLGWVSPTFTLGRPNGWPVDIAATANGGRIDLFVATQDGNVYHRASSVAQGTAAPTWPTGWVQVSGVTAKSPSSGDSITVSSWGPGRLDLYWITPSGNIGHKIAENNAWVATETGDTPETWWLQPSGGTNAYSPPIESASPMVGHLDIVLRTASGTLNHHFWDVDHWDKTALTCCQRPDGVAFSLGDFVLARSGHLSDFHLYAQDYLGSVGGQGQTVLERLVHDGSWNMPGGIVRAMDSSNAFVAVPGSVLLNEGLRWHNEERLDIIGWRNMPGTNDDPAWRFFFQGRELRPRSRANETRADSLSILQPRSRPEPLIVLPEVTLKGSIAMIVRRSLVGTLLCTQALFACYAPDAGEDIATESQATIAFTSSLPILGTWSAGSAVVSRGPGLLDIFWLNDAAQPIWPNTVYYRRYVDGLGWLSTVDLGRPNGWPVDIAATANGGRIDLFVAMQDGKIYHKVSNVSGTNQPTWPINWYQVSGATAKSPSSGDSITVSSWGPGRLDLFWVTPSGNLGHKWAENNTWLGTETGDTPANWFLQPSGGTNAYSPPIESVAPVLGHVDVVLRTASGTLNHHRWYSDQGGWDKTALTCCQRPNGAAFTLSDFVLARRGFGGDFFAYAKNDIGQNQIVMEQLQSEAIGGWFMSGGVVRAWDTTNPFYFGSSSSFHLNEAVLWNNNERLDVIGWSNFPNQNEDPVWRIYFGP